MFGCPQDVLLQRGEEFWPLRVGGVQALVDDGCALGRVGGGLGVGGVRGPPVDAVGQRLWAMTRHGPDRGTGRDQPGGQGEPDLPRAEDDVQRVLSHWPASRMWASAPGGRGGRGRERARVALGRRVRHVRAAPIYLLLIFGPACFGVGGVAVAACFRADALEQVRPGSGAGTVNGAHDIGALAAHYTLVGAVGTENLCRSMRARFPRVD